MTGLLKETIKAANSTLEERGLPSDSFFTIRFVDGTEITEKEYNWSSFCEEIDVEYFGGHKTVFASKLLISQIRMRHGDLEASIDIPEGCRAYQSVRSETVLRSGSRQDTVIGRCIGYIKDGSVIEEKILGGIENTVTGMKQ